MKKQIVEACKNVAEHGTPFSIDVNDVKLLYTVRVYVSVFNRSSDKKIRVKADGSVATLSLRG
jgi:hypothetical protein